ncbi:hypothetical protein BLNAU_21937 [Blattamonas nauphoetae]|uniref:Uncharacterized protein n=1 Tax=Blattamonas nauphoetae TaxID=2049346 RepID=A0ABQ9WUG1_9EUKA|nr:hypothetical protein BLNAU_21937 [Blattamonas nauphoetae]
MSTLHNDFFFIWDNCCILIQNAVEMVLELSVVVPSVRRMNQRIRDALNVSEKMNEELAAPENSLFGKLHQRQAKECDV